MGIFRGVFLSIKAYTSLYDIYIFTMFLPSLSSFSCLYFISVFSMCNSKKDILENVQVAAKIVLVLNIPSLLCKEL